MCSDNNPANTLVIRDLEALRVVADPLRSQILEMLVQGPQTVKQVADKLGDMPNKLYYHFSLLEKSGLIEVAETRQVANMLEKVYRAAARHIDVDPSLVSFTTEEGKNTLRTVIAPVVDTTREDLLRSLQARMIQLEQGAEEHLRQMIVYREVAHLSEARIAEFLERIDVLFHEFNDADEGVPSAASPDYALMIAFYPRFYYENPGAAAPQEDQPPT